jgi:N-acetylglucosaminyl-diphospho-decaprenol L-rhamnosyltransferase
LPTSDISQRVGAVVVNYNGGDSLPRCLASLRDNGVADIVVVDNGSTDSSVATLSTLDVEARLVRAACNGGYGAGANLGAKSLDRELVFICNPDLVAQPAAIESLTAALDEHPEAAVAGPMLLETDGSVYPSGRSFPNLGDSLGHGFVGVFWSGNPWTRRYRLLGAQQLEPRSADWVSGASFLVRRVAFEAVGGFDEAYFMYVEDVDLCWRLHRAGWDVRYEPTARVVHEQGRSTSLKPYRMLLAHHRSILRFSIRSTSGLRRAWLPFVAVALGARLVLVSADHFVGQIRALMSERSAAKSIPCSGGPESYGGSGRKDEGLGRG